MNRAVPAIVLVVAVGVAVAAYFGAQHGSRTSPPSFRPISSLTVTRVSKPETSGIVEGVGLPLSYGDARASDRRAYQEVRGSRVRVYWGANRPDGTGVLVVMDRPGAGIFPANPHNANPHIRFEFFRSPIPGGALHVHGADGRLLQLTNDRGAALKFNMARNRFLPTSG